MNKLFVVLVASLALLACALAADPKAEDLKGSEAFYYGYGAVPYSYGALPYAAAYRTAYPGYGYGVYPYVG